MSTKLLKSDSLTDDKFDGVVLIANTVEVLDCCAVLRQPILDYQKIDSTVPDGIALIPCPVLPGKRLIFSSTGPLNRDYDDIRRIYDAGEAGIKRAVAVGCKKPLIVLGKLDKLPTSEAWTDHRQLAFAAVFGALHATYVPIEVRESKAGKVSNVEALGVCCVCDEFIGLVNAIEEGRILARDIGGSDPERMAAPRIAEHIRSMFPTHCGVSVTVAPVDAKQYPMMAAVDRAAKDIERHAGRVIHLTYEGEGPIDQTLFFVGKGITYDTGGADIKAGGHMAGMHRDKCGAAAVAGFFKVLSILKPKGLRVHGGMAFVRNSVGSNCYVSDEIITSRAGCRVRVGNTDAEGRMVLSDLLCEMKERALTPEIGGANPLIFTVATLTGHVIRCYGENYTGLVDNGKARKLEVSKKLQQAGDLMADPFEISTVRREDFSFIKGPSVYEDVLSCNNLPSAMTSRGHQFPAAFMAVASGLDKHGLDSQHPLAYTHIDIAGSSGPFPGIPTGAPILALCSQFVLARLAKCK